MNNRFVNSKIYALKSASHPEKLYIGSTIYYLEIVMSTLESKYKAECEGKNKYRCSSMELMKYPDCKIELLEEYPCQSREELSKRAGWYIRNTSCVNKRILGRDHKTYLQDNIELIQTKRKIEYDKNVNVEKRRLNYQTNKEEILERRRLNRQNNKEKNNERERLNYQNNKEKILERKRLYRENNKEKVLEKGRLNYQINKEKIIGRKILYYQENKEKILENRRLSRQKKKEEKMKSKE